MASFPIDTLRVSCRLRDVNCWEPQAEVVAFLVAEAREESGRAALRRPELKAELVEFKTGFAQMLVFKWLAGFGLTIGVAILLKLFA